MIALLTSEALQVVNVSPRAHHHLECWDNFAAGCAVTGISEKSVKTHKRKNDHCRFKYFKQLLHAIQIKIP